MKCSHYETRRAGKHGTKTEQIVTHEEDSPILRHSASADYTCTDQSSITTVVRVSGGHIVRHMSPDNLSGDGSLQTGKQYAARAHTAPAACVHSSHCECCTVCAAGTRWCRAA